jgi:hypothetical protein
MAFYLPPVPLPLPWTNAPERPPQPPGLHAALSEKGMERLLPRSRCPDAAPPVVHFSDPDKIRELARRGEALGTSEAKQMLEHAIEQGRGGVWLNRTPEQYGKLRS